MQIKNRNFPYPILNNNKALSDFINSEFKLLYEVKEPEDAYILGNAKFSISSKYLNDLYDEGKIKVYCVIECSSTVYRQAFELTKNGKDIILLKSDFKERVDISWFAVATQNFLFSSDEFTKYYQGYSFEIEKYNIVCANDGINITFKHDESEYNLAQSIFSVIVNLDLDDGIYTVDFDSMNKIVIAMSKKEYSNYKVIYTIPLYQEVFFNMLLIPALIEGLNISINYLNEDATRDIEDLGNMYKWFRSIASSYEKIQGKELTVDDFKKSSLSSFAQELMGKPLGKALIKLVDSTKGGEEGLDYEYN